MYYVLSVSDDYPDGYYFKYDHLRSPNHLVFKSGMILEKNTTRPEFSLNSKVNIDRFMGYDFLMSDGGVFISAKFADLIQNFASNDVQLIEANVHINNNKIKEFYVPNIVSVVACIDMEKSIHKPLIRSDPEGPKNFTRYEFIEDSLGSHKIVRCKEDLGTVVVSEDFVQACNTAGIKGVDFLRNGIIDYD